jgi:hypothetical protein
MKRWYPSQLCKADMKERDKIRGWEVELASLEKSDEEEL